MYAKSGSSLPGSELERAVVYKADSNVCEPTSNWQAKELPKKVTPHA